MSALQQRRHLLATLTRARSPRSITNIYSTELGNKAASNWKGHSLKNVLMLCTSLVSLALHLGPSNASSPLLYLFKDLTTVFSGLKCLESFALPSSELWLHDLATLLACWPKLKTVELEKLRGDVHARRENEAGPIRSVIRTISVNNSTIASRHVEWLLRDQAELCSLELAVPATTHDCRAFDAVATVASNIETLNVWNTYSGASSSRSKSASTSTIPSDSSPLSRVLSNASSLTSLHLYVNLNPSIVLSCLEETDLPKLRRLAIEDTAASGVRVALEEALRAGKLAQLEEVISFGSMRGNSRSNEAGKKLAKVCREKGIEWSDE